jgi:hypothetical protein
VLNAVQRKEQLVAGADRRFVRLDKTPTAVPESHSNPVVDVPPLPFAMPAAIAHTIQQDAAAVGLPLDDAVAAEVANTMLEALRDDEEAAVDLASFVFDADVRRALAG